MTYLCTTFCMLISLVTAIKLTAKDNFSTVTTLIYNILQRHYQNIICLSFEGILPYIRSESQIK
jgi:hypothetical protein